MKEIKLSKKANDTLESARLFAQTDRKMNITKSQMIEWLAYNYLWS